MDSIPPPEVVYVAGTRVACDGTADGVPGHPRVWLQIGPQGFADCGYCDRRFLLTGAATDAH